MSINIIFKRVHVNMPWRQDGMENGCRGMKKLHVSWSSPLSDMKMPKSKPIFHLLKPNYIRNPKGIPPVTDSYIPSIGLF
jgi:hypothetical protein